MSLERYLPAGATYYPSDLYPRDQLTLLCNLNLDALPELPGIQVICTLSAAEYDLKCCRAIQDARFEITNLKLVSTGQYLLACDPV